MYEDPQGTGDMVELDQFLTNVGLSLPVWVWSAVSVVWSSLQSREDTVFRLQAEVKSAAERLQLLLDFVSLPEEDLKLNSQTFKWPARMEPIFEVSQARLVKKREKVEQELRGRRERFEARLEGYHAAVEVFQEREIPRGMEEIRGVTAELTELGASLEECNIEAMEIINEEELLHWDTTPFHQIQAALHSKEPYDRLWNTALSYHDKHHQWMNGEPWREREGGRG